MAHRLNDREEAAIGHDSGRRRRSAAAGYYSPSTRQPRCSASAALRSTGWSGPGGSRRCGSAGRCASAVLSSRCSSRRSRAGLVDALGRFCDCAGRAASVIGVSSSSAASRAVFRGRSPRLATYREVVAGLAWPTWRAMSPMSVPAVYSAVTTVRRPTWVPSRVASIPTFSAARRSSLSICWRATSPPSCFVKTGSSGCDS